MPNPSIRMSDEMREEIENRRALYQGVSAYVREALEMRFQLEDDDEWPDNEQPDQLEA